MFRRWEASVAAVLAPPGWCSDARLECEKVGGTDANCATDSVSPPDCRPCGWGAADGGGCGCVGAALRLRYALMKRVTMLSTSFRLCSCSAMSVSWGMMRCR